MIGVAETLARFAGAHPAIFQARYAALIELGGALGALQALHHTCVHDHQNSKDGQREQQPPEGDPDFSEHEERDHHGG